MQNAFLEFEASEGTMAVGLKNDWVLAMYVLCIRRWMA